MPLPLKIPTPPLPGEPAKKRLKRRLRPGPDRRGPLPGLALLLALLLLGLAACSPFRLLAPRQRLLSRVEVRGQATQAEQDRLLTLVQQEPNSRFPLPKLAIYQLGYTFYNRERILKKQQAIRDDFTKQVAKAGTDSAQIGQLLARRERALNRRQLALDKGNAIMRLGEAPVVYDSALTRRTVEQMSTYLRTQGYFRSRVRAIDTARYRRSVVVRGLRALGIGRSGPHDSLDRAVPYRRVALVYEVERNRPFVLAQLTTTIPDSGVARVLRQGQGETLLKVGETYNEDRIGEERQRLETQLKNAGYYDFRQQYITLEADTSFAPFTVRLRTLIANPGPGQGHRVYRLRRVTMVTDNGANRVLRQATTGTGVGAAPAAPAPLPRSAADTLRQAGSLPPPAGRTPAADGAGTAGGLGGRPARPPRDTTLVDSVRYAAYRLAYSTRVLGQKLTLRPGQRFSLLNTQRTQRQLADLDMFRFNTVTYRKVEAPTDTTTSTALGVSVPAGASPTRAGAGADALRNQRGGSPVPTPSASADSAAHNSQLIPHTSPDEGLLDAVVNAAPAKRFQETTEFGGTLVADKLGPFLNVRLKWRNPFGGAELLELGARVGFEGQYVRLADGRVNTDQSRYAAQFGATASLLLPQFLLPFRQGSYLAQYNPKTRFSLSDTYVNRPEYTRTNIEFSYDYLWQRSAFHQFVLSPVVISLINASNISDEYQAALDELQSRGSPLYRSFVRQLVPSMALTSLYNSNDFNQTRDARYLRLSAEVGGLTRGLYRQRLAEATRRDGDEGLQVYNFARLSADYRRYFHLTPRTYFVYRLNGGVAHALSRTEDGQLVIPYDRSFFAGGSTSLRAWGPRRLGPGSYTSYIAERNENGEPIIIDPNTTPPTVRLIRDFVSEQPGELLLEGSVEYRFPVYSFVKGALFTDVGNVWSLQADDGRPGATFKLNSFYQQIAVGSGIGVRFDFTFLILRLDVATRIFDPTAPSGEQWALRNFGQNTKNPTAFNLGIGYPF